MRMSTICDFTMTPAAEATIGIEVAQRLVARHRSGDWGAVGTYAATAVTAGELAIAAVAGLADDAKRNKIALDTDNGRVLSEYRVEGKDVWVLTDLGEPWHRDRIEGTMV